MSGRRVAVDLGASSGRVAVGWLVNGVLEYEIVHRFANGPVETPEGLKWDFDRLVGEVEKGLKMAGKGGEVASVGVDSWAVDYGIVDSAGRMLCSPFHYRDSRTDGVMEREIEARGQEIFAETGLQFLPFNTLYQTIAHQKVSPELFVEGNRLLMVPDLIHFILGGKAGIERTNASTTQFYSPLLGSWSEKLTGLVPGLRGMLPEILDAGDDLGGVRADLAACPGLGGTRILAPATHDTGSGVLAVPFENAGSSAFVVSGTWSLVGLELEWPLISEEVRALNFSNEIGAKGTVRFLKNVMGLWIFQECCRAWGVWEVGELVEAASEFVDKAGEFDPDERRFLEPGLDMPERVRAATPGLGDEPAQVSAAIFKSLATKTAEVVGQAAGLAGKKLSRIHVTGGGSQNRLLNQLIANASGLPVTAGPVEATLIGNLLTQFEAAGELQGSIRETVRRGTELETFWPET